MAKWLAINSRVVGESSSLISSPASRPLCHNGYTIQHSNVMTDWPFTVLPSVRKDQSSPFGKAKSRILPNLIKYFATMTYCNDTMLHSCITGMVFLLRNSAVPLIQNAIDAGAGDLPFPSTESEGNYNWLHFMPTYIWLQCWDHTFLKSLTNFLSGDGFDSFATRLGVIYHLNSITSGSGFVEHSTQEGHPKAKTTFSTPKINRPPLANSLSQIHAWCSWVLTLLSSLAAQLSSNNILLVPRALPLWSLGEFSFQPYQPMATSEWYLNMIRCDDSLVTGSHFWLMSFSACISSEWDWATLVKSQ